MAHFINDIADYFEALCENHPLLQHAEATGERIFEVVAYDEAFGDFRTAAREKTYFVRLILPTMTWDNEGNNARKHYETGFMVGRYFSTREESKADKLAALADAEQVADDFIARMVYDSREGHDLFHSTIDNISNLSLSGDFVDFAGDGSYVAVLYMFSFASFRCVDGAGSDFQAVGWLDL